MTVLLVLATFVFFLLLDYLLHRRAATQPVLQAARGSVARPLPDVVAGFKLPENLRYHPGHTWALAESPTMVRIGLDDFASRLIGRAEALGLPKRGQWLRQGQKLVTVLRDGAAAELVSPMEGMVTDVNPALAADPELARRDPYGEGWIVTLHSPDAKTNFRNLLGGLVARKWLEESALRLASRMPALAGAVAQDGGLAVDNIARLMPDETWSELTREFFLS
jgi:glycine cleavage system H lipoate-binding protein